MPLIFSNAKYESRMFMEADLSNAHDARIAGSKRSGGKTSVTACMSRTDAAKGFAERLRPVADSLKFAATNAIEARHPKLKSEAWQKTKLLHGRFAGLRSIVESLDKEKAAPFEPVAELYAKAEIKTRGIGASMPECSNAFTSPPCS